jgi:hypothetical protein
MSVNPSQNKKRLKIFEKISNQDFGETNFEDKDDNSILSILDKNFEIFLPKLSQFVVNDVEFAKYICNAEISKSTDIAKSAYIDYEKEFSENFNCLHLSFPSKTISQHDIFTFLSLYGGIENLKVESLENMSQ